MIKATEIDWLKVSKELDYHVGKNNEKARADLSEGSNASATVHITAATVLLALSQAIIKGITPPEEDGS